MPDFHSPQPAYLRDFLALYNAHLRADRLSPQQWDMVLRMGWSAGMLGALAERVAAQGTAVPAQAERHFESIRSTVRYRQKMAHIELTRVAATLAPLDIPLILAKGVAYLLQDLPCGRWRLFADVDLIVPRTHIDKVERLLLDAGWASDALDPYDQHYYRVWSHELPPMRYGAHPLELDVHHTILPLTGRVQPDAEAMFDAALPLEGTAFHVLCPQDQVLHACAHLFQDSDLSDRLRELADIDGLLRAYGESPVFWAKLEERTLLHGMQRPLFYALRYARAYFETPQPQHWDAGGEPGALTLRLMDCLVHAALPPCHPDGRAKLPVRTARLLLYIRSLWLRMPPWLLLRHLMKKGLRRVGAPKDDTEEAA